MSAFRILFRDIDRLPYLHVLRDAAAARRLDVDLRQAPHGRRFAEFLLDGEVDVLAENYWSLQSLAASGVPLVSLASTVATLNETLFLAPGLSSASELRGGSFALRDVGPSGLIARLWLNDHGLEDVNAVLVPEAEVGRWGQWKAVANGACRGVFVTNLHAKAARDAGLAPVAIPAYGFLGNVTLTTHRDIVDSRPEELVALVGAAFDASRRFREDEQGTLRILRRDAQALLGLDETGLRAACLTLRDELSPAPVPTAAAIANTHRMRLGQAPELAGFNPLLMWDLRFARIASGG